MISSAATTDLEIVIAYLSSHHGIKGITYFDQLVDKINELSQFPERCKIVPYAKFKKKRYRYLVVHPFYVFFKIVQSRVIILRILH
ncbi:MAG: type II toxin-antitoxin system RelE/ParE family toxin [Bacilli bacterium]